MTTRVANLHFWITLPPGVRTVEAAEEEAEKQLRQLVSDDVEVTLVNLSFNPGSSANVAYNLIWEVTP